MSMENLEQELKDLFFQDVNFIVNNKIIKSGKVKIFSTKQFFIKFKLEIENQLKDYELPYPYIIYKNNNEIIFDYCLSAFCPTTEEFFFKALLFDKEKASKIHNNYLRIQIK